MPSASPGAQRMHDAQPQTPSDWFTVARQLDLLLHRLHGRDNGNCQPVAVGGALPLQNACINRLSS